MDLQTLLKNKRSSLKPCKTVITNTLGEKYEIIDGEKKQLGHTLPFVIDEKPDLEVACIMPGLFLSSQDPAVDIEILQKLQIHHILSIGIDLSIKFDTVKYHYCELLDLPECDILRPIEKCIKIIHTNRQQNILVHCNAGVSRSATIVIAYLMVLEKLSYADAFSRIKAVRSCIKPNEGFVKQLKTLESSSISL